MINNYDGALVMPKNYAVVTEDEMAYVEGGGVAQKLVYQGVKIGVNKLVGGKKVRLALNVIRSSAFKKGLINVLDVFTSRSKATSLANKFLGTLTKYLPYDAGTAVAEFLDCRDGKNDNQIYISKIF